MKMLRKLRFLFLKWKKTRETKKEFFRPPAGMRGTTSGFTCVSNVQKLIPIFKIKPFLRKHTGCSKETPFWSFLAKFFLQNDSLEVFLCEKSITRIEKP